MVDISILGALSGVRKRMMDVNERKPSGVDPLGAEAPSAAPPVEEPSNASNAEPPSAVLLSTEPSSAEPSNSEDVTCAISLNDFPRDVVEPLPAPLLSEAPLNEEFSSAEPLGGPLEPPFQAVISGGDRLDRYELLCPIARGGMAEVWITRLHGKHGFEKLFAVKMIRPDFAAESRFRSMFLDEARIAANLVHPNIAQVHDLGEENGVLYIAMDWVRGESLHRLLNVMTSQGKRLPLGVALRVAREICSGLHYAHTLSDSEGEPMGIVHRDVSPQNILISISGHSKLIDFGIAKAQCRLSDETTHGTLKGNLEYMSPEQANGEGVDARADVWSVGAVLYRCLSGAVPYRSESQIVTLKRLSAGEPWVPLPPSVPEPVKAIVKKALQFRREDRYESAEALREDIEAAILATDCKTTSAEVSALMKEHLGLKIAGTVNAVKQALQAAHGGALPTDYAQLSEPSFRTATPIGIDASGFYPVPSSPSPRLSIPIPERPRTKVERSPVRAQDDAAVSEVTVIAADLTPAPSSLRSRLAVVAVVVLALLSFSLLSVSLLGSGDLSEVLAFFEGLRPTAPASVADETPRTPPKMPELRAVAEPPTSLPAEVVVPAKAAAPTEVAAEPEAPQAEASVPFDPVGEPVFEKERRGLQKSETPIARPTSSHSRASGKTSKVARVEPPAPSAPPPPKAEPAPAIDLGY